MKQRYLYLIRTDEHGLEREAFYTPEEAVQVAKQLSNMAAYRGKSVEVWSIDSYALYRHDTRTQQLYAVAWENFVELAENKLAEARANQEPIRPLVPATEEVTD